MKRSSANRLTSVWHLSLYRQAINTRDIRLAPNDNTKPMCPSNSCARRFGVGKHNKGKLWPE